MLTEEVGPPLIKINQNGDITITKLIVVKKDGKEIHSYYDAVTLLDSDEPASAEQAAVLPEVKARLAAAQGVIAKKEKPVPPKPKE